VSWEDMNRELSRQRIAELHADAERFRQVRASKRRRGRRRLGRLRRQLWPTGVASRANGIVGAILSPAWPSRRDTMGPTRLYSPPLAR
jgi:hypothetical protein